MRKQCVQLSVQLSYYKKIEDTVLLAIELYTRLPPADDKRVRGERSQRVSQRELQRHAQTLGHRSFLLWTRSYLLVRRFTV